MILEILEILELLENPKTTESKVNPTILQGDSRESRDFRDFRDSSSEKAPFIMTPLSGPESRRVPEVGASFPGAFVFFLCCPMLEIDKCQKETFPRLFVKDSE